MKSFVLALLLVAAASPTFAASAFPYSTFGAELDQEGRWDNAVQLEPEKGFFDKVELAGGLKLSLGQTSMSTLSDAFGNGVQTYQYVGYTTSWLCYIHAGRRVWYIADLTYETTDELNIGSVIDEPADPATDDLFHCAAEPRAMLAKQVSLPTVGATLGDLRARFKADIPAGTTLASGMSDGAAEGSGIYDMKIVTYRLKGDVVDAIDIAEDYMGADEDAQ